MKLKKPNFWDSKKPNLISYLLLPLTIPIRINNFFLNNISKKKYKEIKTICVGNIYLGGTGKTPITIKLYEILSKQGLNIVTAKKFYKSQLDEQTILNKKTKFISGFNREQIIQESIKNKFDLIIFDDGLQESRIDYDLKFVCFDTKNWIGNNFLIPSGPLREKLDSLKKYDGIFLKESKSNYDEIIKLIKMYNKDIKIFFTDIEITNLNKFDLNKKFLIFSGIGNPTSFKETLQKNNFKIIKEIIYPDHHDYKKKDIIEIISQAKQLNAEILTTEKDFVKLPKEHYKEINFLEIKVAIKNENELTNLIKSKIE